MQELKILVVARQPAFAKLLRGWLEDAGYVVTDAFDEHQALREFVRHQPACVVLDMPGRRQEGFDLLAHIRELSHVPVILLSNRSSETDKAQGLSLGADDYLVKPIGCIELLARIEAILRRSGWNATGNEGVYADSVLTIDFSRHSVYVEGEEVPLTVLEYNLLACLVKHSGQVLTTRSLLDHVWGSEYDECEYVKWHISRLRRKIEEDPENPKLVTTVRGVGYRYDPPANGANGHHGRSPAREKVA